MSVEIITSYPSRTNTRRANYKNTSFNSLSRTQPVKWIGIHGTGGGSIQDSTFLNYIFSTSYKSSFHYFIGDTGKVYEVVPPTRWSRVANWPDLAVDSPNESQAIHIECYNRHSNNQDAFSDKTIKSLFELILYTLEQYPDIIGLAGHGAGSANAYPVRGLYKNCPGNLFPWDDLYTFLEDRGYTFDKKDVRYKQAQRGKDPVYPARPGVARGEIIENLVLADPDAPRSDPDEKQREELNTDNTTNYDGYNDPSHGGGGYNTNADIFADDPFTLPVGLLDIAVEGATLIVAGGTVTFDPIVPTTTKIQGKSILKIGDTYSGTISGSTITKVPFVPTLTNNKIMVEGKFVLKMGDISGAVSIQNAGQTKVKSL